MGEIEDEVRRARRLRLLAAGGASDYRDPQIYEHVDRLLLRALETRNPDALLIPHLAGDEVDSELRLHLEYSSHRPVIGPFLIFVKRRILLPLTRWLWEYSLENFRRQREVNRVLFACIEELAIENAKLREEIGAGGAGRAGEAGREVRLKPDTTQ